MCKVGVIQLRQGKAVLQHRSQIIRILLIVPERAGEHYTPPEVMAGQLVGSHPPHVNHWINSYRHAKECTWTVVLFYSENHTFWQMCNCYCFLKLVHKKDAENSSLVNNFNWILRAKFCQSLFPLDNTSLCNYSINTVEVCIRCHGNKRQSRTSFEHWSIAPVVSFSSSPSLQSCSGWGTPSLIQTISAYSVGISERLGVLLLSIHSIHFVSFLSRTAWRPDQILISSGHDPFLLWKMSIQFPNSHPAFMSLGYYK